MTFPLDNVQAGTRLGVADFGTLPRTEACSSRYRSFVNGKLLGRLLQFDGDFMIRLIDAEIFSVRPESRRNHLNANFAVRNARGFRFAIVMGLQFKAFLL